MKLLVTHRHWGMEGLFVMLRNLVYVLCRMEAIHSKPLCWVVTGSPLHSVRITLVWGHRVYWREGGTLGERHVKLVQRGGGGGGSGLRH